MAGEEKAIAQLNRLQKISMVEAQLAVNKLIYEGSQALVPVDTGELKDSGEYDENSVTYKAGHAAHVEFGTVKMKAQPYLRPAVESRLGELAKVSAMQIQEEIKEAI